MTKRLVLIAGVLVIAAIALVSTRPSEFVIERSAAIEAAPDVVYEHIASLRAMDVWSPWVRMDEQMKVVYAGPESGVGARSSWEGPEMGEGRLTVTAVRPAREVEMKLEMFSPMRATNRIVFTLTPADAGTRVTWRMEGRNGFVGKAIGLFMDMDGMVGGPFEQGLAALKGVAEADAAKET
jgi:Polyketide cyclase / dehydrase and lipid transport